MKTTNLMKTAQKHGNKVINGFKKNSPEICMGLGVLGIGISGALLIKSTLTVDDIFEEHKEKIEKIHKTSEAAEKDKSIEYPKEAAQKDLTAAYVGTGWKVVKHYSLAVGVGFVSVGLMIGSNRILRKRNMELAAAFAVVNKGFKEYRGRVVDKYGEEVDREMMYGMTSSEVEVTKMNEDGTTETVTETVKKATIDPSSTYARVFRRGNKNWEDVMDYNRMFLKAQLSYANDLLISRGENGIVLLNEIYDMLGFERTQEGNIVGWRYCPNDADHTGDSYISFDIVEIYDDELNEMAFLLDFNVDGNVWKYMPKGNKDSDK